MKERNLTCIVCPMGCQIKVTFDGDSITSVEGNTCPRGDKYARNECTNPQRTVTSTVLCDNGKMLSVKTSETIQKDKMFEFMKIINSVKVTTPVKIGDVIIKNVFGVDVVATENIN